MAESQRSALRVGLVVAVAAALAAGAIFSIGRGTRFFTGAEILEAHFHRTNGLQAGAPVSLSGVNIGAVESIRFPPDPAAEYVVVKLWVEGSAAPRVRADCQAQIRTMGLLGDKYVELTAGTSSAPPAEPGALLKSEDPLDYEALLRRPGTGDFLANIMATADSLRSILEDLEKGQGLLGQLLRGEGTGKQLNLATVTDTFDRLDRLSARLEETIERLNHGNGLAAAMLSSKTNGRQVVADLASSAASLKATTERLDKLTARLEGAQGTLPQLVEDRAYANQVLAELRQSTHDLQQILRKVNSGEGTLGELVNDPSLYYEAKGVLGGGGWGTSVLRGLYGLTHPFKRSEMPAEPTGVVVTTAPEQSAGAVTPPPVAAPEAPIATPSADSTRSH